MEQDLKKQDETSNTAQEKAKQANPETGEPEHHQIGCSEERIPGWGE